jgi:5-methylcytosine-specific restriction endonuclease McrA
MPYKNKADRDYKHEYEAYQGKPEQIKNRAKRNSARAKLAQAGRVKKGDGKDVDHAIPLSKGGGNLSSNLRVKSKSANRSYKRTSSGAVK